MNVNEPLIFLILPNILVIMPSSKKLSLKVVYIHIEFICSSCASAKCQISFGFPLVFGIFWFSETLEPKNTGNFQGLQIPEKPV